MGNLIPSTVRKIEEFYKAQSSGITSICTETFGVSDRNPSVPNNLTVFYYRFTSVSEAQAYVTNASSYFNDTPWPAGLKTFASSSKGRGNTTIYFTTITGATNPPLTVLTVYTIYNSTVLGVSSFVLTAFNKTSSEQLLTELLYKEYAKFTNA